MRALLVLLSVIGLSLCGCGQVITVPTPTPFATSPVNLPTVTPRSTSTPAPATPAPTSTPAPSPTPVIHKVQPGDTIIGIAKQYGISAEVLQEANAILNPQLLQIGQELIIPREGRTMEETPISTPIPLPFEVEGLGFYETPAGSLWCLGEVNNTSGRDIERVQIEVSLYDEEDKVLGLMQKLLRSATENGAQCLVTPCPLCQTNLDAYQSRVNARFKTDYKLPVLFISQLIGLALGIGAEHLGLNTNIVSPREILNYVYNPVHYATTH